VLKSWQVASLMCHKESKTEKMMKRTKNRNYYSSEDTVQIIVHGVSPDRRRESMVGRICERVIGFKPRVRVREFQTARVVNQQRKRL